jgi:beta-phosphoglucomutase-like phosphatase (HAD superfamily)
VVVDVDPNGLTAAREAGALLAVAVARSSATPAELRKGGAQAVVADLQELLGPVNG